MQPFSAEEKFTTPRPGNVPDIITMGAWGTGLAAPSGVKRPPDTFGSRAVAVDAVVLGHQNARFIARSHRALITPGAIAGKPGDPLMPKWASRTFNHARDVWNDPSIGRTARVIGTTVLGASGLVTAALGVPLMARGIFRRK
jgi:hypothetical protein